MGLVEKIKTDNKNVFMNLEQFGSRHTWNGIPFLCVTDEESAMIRKNHNVVDISWDNNTRETILYLPTGTFPGKAWPNEQGFFDRRSVKILQVQEDCGMQTILLVEYTRKAVGG